MFFEGQLRQSAEDLATLTSLKNGSRAQSEAALALALQESEAVKAEVAQLRKALQAEIDKGNLEGVQLVLVERPLYQEQELIGRQTQR